MSKILIETELLERVVNLLKQVNPSIDSFGSAVDGVEKQQTRILRDLRRLLRDERLGHKTRAILIER